MSSLHIDSIMLFAAHFSGLDEVTLEGPVYHIDHSMGWNPMTNEGTSYYDQMRTAGVPVLDWSEVRVMVERMASSPGLVLFNGEKWGLAGIDLKETQAKAPASESPLTIAN